MAKQTLNNAESGSVIRGKINDNFTEVYDDIAGFAGVSDGDKGDITVSASGASWTIDVGAVSYAKIQDVSAASKLLGRGDDAAGDVQEITIGSGLTMTGTTLSASGGGTVDSTITDGGTNPVEGNAIFDALALKANLAAPVLTGAWDLRAGYGTGGMRPYNASGSVAGFGIYNYFGTYCGSIYGDNSGNFLIENAAGGYFYIVGNEFRSGRFHATDANGGDVATPLYVLDATSSHEGGFYCPVVLGAKDKQYWVSERTDRVSLDRTGKLELLSGKLRLTGLPTSASGLSTGDVWNDSGTLKIV